MGLLRGLVPSPRCVADIDKLLPQAWRMFLDACSSAAATSVENGPRKVTFTHAKWASGRLDELLDARLELHRREQEHHVEEWWCLSHPCTAPPEWPEDQADAPS